MSQVSGMNHVEHPMTHDDLALTRTFADQASDLAGRLDLVLVAAAQGFHERQPSLPRCSNQVLVAAEIDCGSHSGASRHSAISASISRTPWSKETVGRQPRSRRILPISAQVTSGSPGRLGM